MIPPYFSLFTNPFLTKNYVQHKENNIEFSSKMAVLGIF
jgi:hypothetical protein